MHITNNDPLQAMKNIKMLQYLTGRNPELSQQKSCQRKACQ